MHLYLIADFPSVHKEVDKNIEKKPKILATRMWQQQILYIKLHGFSGNNKFIRLHKQLQQPSVHQGLINKQFRDQISKSSETRQVSFT